MSSCTCLLCVRPVSCCSTMPADAAERCSDGSCWISVTQVFPRPANKLYGAFSSRQQLVKALLASCHLPRYVYAIHCITLLHRCATRCCAASVERRVESDTASTVYTTATPDKGALELLLLRCVLLVWTRNNIACCCVCLPAPGCLMAACSPATSQCTSASLTEGSATSAQCHPSHTVLATAALC